MLCEELVMRVNAEPQPTTPIVHKTSSEELLRSSCKLERGFESRLVKDDKTVEVAIRC